MTTTQKRTVFDAPFGSGMGQLPIEAGRYRLIWSHSCPWSQRQVIALTLLGLDQVISLGTVNPVWTEKGWDFTDQPGGVDPVLGIRYLQEAYDKADPDCGGEVIVPTVAEESSGKAVNTDHAALLTYWEKDWKPFHKKDAPDLRPAPLEKEIDGVNELLLSRILLAPYQASGAQTQEAYDRAYEDFFAAADELDRRLSTRRFLLGDYVTDPDLRLYVFLVRYDLLFYPLCGLNRNLLSRLKHLWGYARELHSIPAFKDTTVFEDIKRGAQLGDTTRNPYGILTKGPDLSAWNDPAEERQILSADPQHLFLLEK